MRVVAGTSPLAWVVLIVLGGLIAAGVFLPPLHSVNPNARKINCAGNLKQIGLALLIYAGDDVEEGYLPDGETFARLNDQRYLVNGKVYGCPGRFGKELQRNRAGDSDYVYLGAGVMDTDPRYRTLIIAHDRLGNHEGWVNCLYVDGHVKGWKTAATTWHEFRLEREAAGDHFANRPPWAGPAE